MPSKDIRALKGRPNSAASDCVAVIAKKELFLVLPLWGLESGFGFSRLVPIEEIRAKEGNLSIPLFVGGETQAQTDAATESATTALPKALTKWFQSSQVARKSLAALGI